MANAPRPHISHALQHLRNGVYGAAGVFMVALLVQLVCWTVIHFGAPDTKKLEPKAGAGQATVVHAPSKAEKDAAPIEKPDLSPVTEQEVASAEPSINEVPTGIGLVMHRLADTSQIVGIIAAIALVLFLVQAVTVAGGGGVPGVEMVVTAGTWAFVLCALAMPWAGVLPEVSFGGVLRSGEGMSAGARLYAAGDANAAAYFGVRVVLPFLMMGGVFACALRFRAGVRKGIIVTHASMLDEQLEAELRKRKVGEGMTPRSVGALNTAIGEAPSAPPSPPPMASPAKIPTPHTEPMSKNYADEGNGRRPI